jgi:hypothetical protein
MSGEQAVILVYSTGHAVRAEKLLQEEGIPSKLVPVPRHLSSDCGVCVRISLADADSARRILDAASMEVQGIHAI